MKNHFLFAYRGNKRDEVEKIHEYTKKFYNLDNIETIVENYCGSCAYSFFLSTLYPKRFKYVLNDNDESLNDLINLIKTEDYNVINNKMNELINNFNTYTDDVERKKYYLTICDNKNVDVYSFLFINKYYTIRCGLYPMMNKYKQIKPFKIQVVPFYNFIKTENIEWINGDGIETTKKYKDDEKTLMFIDPPYINTCNDFYENTDMSVYEYIYDNNINDWKCCPVLCLENIWIIKMLFRENNVCIPYNKQYQGSKKKTTHIIITKK